MPYGTNTLVDSSTYLTFGDAYLDQTVEKFGEQKAYEEIQKHLNAYEAQLTELRSEFSRTTDEFSDIYGGIEEIEIVRGNEFSDPDAVKIGAGITVGFRLDKFEVAQQFTRRSFQTMTLAKLRAQVLAIMTANVKKERYQIQNAIFTATNEANYVDVLTEKRRTFDVYSFLNADGRPVPVSPVGGQFDPDTHTHFCSATELTEAVIRETIQNVAEHNTSGEVALYIPRQMDSLVRAMTASGAFNPRRHEDVIPVMPTASGISMYAGFVNEVLDRKNIYSRELGSFEGYPVRVRPWVPDQYILAMDTGDTGTKPLVYRTLAGGLYSELGLRFEDESYPLRSKVWDRYGDYSVHQRHMGAVTYISGDIDSDSALGTSYVSPTL